MPSLRRSRKKALAYEELFAQEWERVLDQQARAIAGQEGRPPFSSRASETLEREAWDGTDTAVTPEHLAQIAIETVQELAEERDERGMPVWSPEQIELEVKYRQSMAMHPWRAMTFTNGRAEDDFAGQASEAERLARRFNPAPVAPVGSWSAPVEEEEAFAEPPETPRDAAGRRETPPEDEDVYGAY